MAEQGTTPYNPRGAKIQKSLKKADQTIAEVNALIAQTADEEASLNALDRPSDDSKEGKENRPGASRRTPASIMPLTLPATPADKQTFAFGPTFFADKDTPQSEQWKLHMSAEQFPSSHKPIVLSDSENSSPIESRSGANSPSAPQARSFAGSPSKARPRRPFKDRLEEVADGEAAPGSNTATPVAKGAAAVADGAAALGRIATPVANGEGAVAAAAGDSEVTPRSAQLLSEWMANPVGPPPVNKLFYETILNLPQDYELSPENEAASWQPEIPPCLAAPQGQGFTHELPPMETFEDKLPPLELFEDRLEEAAEVPVAPEVTVKTEDPAAEPVVIVEQEEITVLPAAGTDAAPVVAVKQTVQVVPVAKKAPSLLWRLTKLGLLRLLQLALCALAVYGVHQSGIQLGHPIRQHIPDAPIQQTHTDSTAASTPPPPAPLDTPATAYEAYVNQWSANQKAPVQRAPKGLEPRVMPHGEPLASKGVETPSSDAIVAAADATSSGLEHLPLWAQQVGGQVLGSAAKTRGWLKSKLGSAAREVEEAVPPVVEEVWEGVSSHVGTPSGRPWTERTLAIVWSMLGLFGLAFAVMTGASLLFDDHEDHEEEELVEEETVAEERTPSPVPQPEPVKEDDEAADGDRPGTPIPSPLAKSITRATRSMSKVAVSAGKGMRQATKSTAKGIKETSRRALSQRSSALEEPAGDEEDVSSAPAPRVRASARKAGRPPTDRRKAEDSAGPSKRPTRSAVTKNT